MESKQTTFQEDIDSGQRFKFGANWKKFLSVLSDERIDSAILSLKEMLELDKLDGKTFLDIGSGSGLFSLAARKMGATVHSFDYDPSSVWCTRELKERYFKGDEKWVIEQGSALDSEYMESLGKFDIVYSWGVLHHTGDMFSALENAGLAVKRTGALYIALYNYQQFASFYWLCVKKLYNKFFLLRPVLIATHIVYPIVPAIILQRVQNRKSPRGMTIWYDLLDWLGGYPFEVSTPEQVFDFYRLRQFELTKLKTVGGKMGCNEFVFKKSALPL